MVKKFIIIVGESGSGKDYLAKHLSETLDLSIIKSYTTRKPRFEGENTHRFIDPSDIKEFEHELIDGAYVDFHNNIYFATISQIMDNDVYILDAKNAQTLKDTLKREYDIESLIVYITSSEETRFYRMLMREYSKQFSRLAHDNEFFSDFQFDSFILNNSSKDGASKQIIEVVQNFLRHTQE